MNDTTTTRTYQLGALRVTVEGPEMLVGKAPTFSYEAKTDAEFDGIVEAVGGPGAFGRPSNGDYAVAYSAEGLAVLLYAPRVDRPVDRPAIRRLREHQEQAKEATAA